MQDVKPYDLINPVFKTEITCPIKLQEANGIVLVSISGGSDSDIVMDLVERHKGSAHVKYVWYDTGLEFEATKRHIEYLRERYGVEIERFQAVVSIPTSCKKHGVPFLSKYVSDEIHRLQRNGFKWEDRPFDELYADYPKCKQALKWWCNQWPETKSGRKSSKNISNNKYLKEFIIENPPDFTISPYCCDGAKKRTKNHAISKYDAVLNITGERRSEGGVRATAYNSCFSPSTDKNIAYYRVIFFWSDSDKQSYKLQNNIVHSDCYRVWGMKRTGCAGCPFGSRFEDELKIIEKYEPKLYAAVNCIFGKAYEYTRKFRLYKERMKNKCN